MIDQNSEFYNQSAKLWLHDNSIEIYSTHNEAKSIVAEECLEILKSKTHNYVTAVSKNVYVNKLDEIVHKYNNTYRTIKMRHVDIQPAT